LYYWHRKQVSKNILNSELLIMKNKLAILICRAQQLVYDCIKRFLTPQTEVNTDDLEAKMSLTRLSSVDLM
jgi:hypothetical protein